MKIYLASAFSNRDEVRAVMGALIAAGHSITWDWTDEAIDRSWPQEKQDAYISECGRKDYAGVVNADALVFINHKEGRDSRVELGIAMGLDIATYILFPDRHESVFFDYSTKCPTVGDLLEHLE